MHIMCFFQNVSVAIQGGPKKLHTAFFAITLPTLNHFFYNFWHMYTIGNLQTG